MIDWPQIQAGIIGAIGVLVAVAPVAIRAWFTIKADIAENKARIDIHDVRSGVPSAAIVTADKGIAAGPSDASTAYADGFPRHPIPADPRPIQPMPAMPQSKINTP